jgi:Ca2+-binding RTX toxin-like protein
MRKYLGVSRPALKRISSGGVVLALVALFGLPTAAFAAPVTATVVGDPATVTVTADGQENQLSISDTASFVLIRDSREGVSAGGGCTLNPADSDELRCPKPAGGVTIIIVNLGAGDDILLSVGVDEPMTINGGDGDDILNGGNLDDTINAGNGDDLLDGKSGADALNGQGNAPVNPEGDTTSYISTVDRNVSLDGVANDGAALEGDNVDTENVTTAGGEDTLTGDALANVLTAGAGDDTLNGAAGDDTLVGGSGSDALNGGANIDNVSYNPESRDVSVTAGSGAGDDGVIDVDNGTPGNQSEGDTVAADVESIAGGGGDDNLVGGTGAGTIAGNGGNDVLNGGADTLSDTISGGSGLDTVSYAGRTNPVTVTLDGNNNDGETGENDNVLANVENATGGAGADSITGNDSVNRLNGGNGADDLFGGANNDVLVGGAGGDTLAGQVGTGDLADYSAEVAALTITIDGVANDAGQGDNVTNSTENVTGGDGADMITGSDAANRLNGGAGNDTLIGGLGNDVLNGQDDDDDLRGGTGSDTLTGDTADGPFGADIINGGTGGGDTTSYAGRPAAVDVRLGIPGGDGQAGENDDVQPDVERVTGTSFDDTIIGETTAGPSQPNIFNGGNGADLLRGGDGNDTVNGGDGADTVIGNFGQDSLVGGSGNDDVRGADLNPPTRPNGYKDNLNCGTGVDTHTNDSLDFVGASCE